MIEDYNPTGRLLLSGILALLVTLLSACAQNTTVAGIDSADDGPIIITEEPHAATHVEEPTTSDASTEPVTSVVMWALEPEPEKPAMRGLLSLKPPTPAKPPEAAWLVSRFQESESWLHGFDEFHTADTKWSRLLARQIVEHLRREEDRVITMNRQLSHGQVQQLINQGLRYRIAGSIKQLRQENRQADGIPALYGTLVITYQLERRMGGNLNVVQTDRLQADVRIADRVQPRHLETLIDQVAKDVVGAVQMSCAQDIMGMVD